MKRRLLKIMAWIADHIDAVIALSAAGVAQMAQYLKLRHDVASLQKQSDQHEKTIDEHVASPVLHRTPDFETGQKEVKAEIARMNIKLDRIIELLPRSR